MPLLINEEEIALLPNAIDVIYEREALVSMLQRYLRIGYPPAARIMERLELLGIVASFEGAAGKPRQILMTKTEALDKLKEREAAYE